MAAPALKRPPVKSLNQAPTGKRFVFKTFSQRIKELNVNVFRSLDPLKLQPTQGTSFFHESLLQWRELNSAADYLEVYEQLFPIVQTFPQLLLQKHLVINTLLSHLQLSAVLSLEPIMSLIATLSRDLQADFIPYIPQLLECCVGMLKAGGDKEPDVIEQIFSSFSLILKYMQKFLSKDIVFVLKVTKNLRYYYRFYIQEFAAEAVSFLLRKASLRQIMKGLQTIYAEIVNDPSDENISSCSALLCHTLKGPVSNLQSRAEPVIRILLKLPFFKCSRKKDPGGKMIAKVIANTFCRLCDELSVQKLSLVWLCLLDEIHHLLETYSRVEECNTFKENEVNDSIGLVHAHTGACNTGVLNDSNGTELWGIDKERAQDTPQDTKAQLAYCIFLLNNILEFRRGRRVSDINPFLNLVQRLVQWRILYQAEEGRSVKIPGPVSHVKLHTASLSLFHSEVLRLLLALVRSCHVVAVASSDGLDIIANACFWDTFELTRLLPLIHGLLEEDVSVVSPFASSLLRVFDRFIWTDPVDILPLMMDFLHKLDMATQDLHAIIEHQNIQRINFFISVILKEAARRIGANILVEDNDFCATAQALSLEPSIVWATLQCSSFMLPSDNDSSLLPSYYAMQLSHFLLVPGDYDDCKEVWEHLLGTALLADLKLKLCFPKAKLLKHLQEYLSFAENHSHSPYVLNAVADFLDNCLSEHLSDLREDERYGVFKLLEGNLAMPSKLLRLSALRILTKYASISSSDQGSLNCQKVSDISSADGDKSTCNVLELLLSIEAAPLCLDVSRQSSLVITRLKDYASAGRMTERCLPTLTHAMVGVLHNPFKPLWDSAVDCLAALLEVHSGVAWDIFIKHLQSIQILFLSCGDCMPEPKTVLSDNLPKDLWDHFEHSFRNKEGSTDSRTVVILLLQVLEKVPAIAESRSRQLIPLFFTFVEYSDMNFQRDTGISPRCRKKEWRAVMKEWLGLLKRLKNARSFFKSSILKELLIDRFLQDRDADIQQRAFDCLLNWRDTFLIPYEENLKKLISLKTLREELTTWNVGKGTQQLQDEHRGGLIPLLILILYSKMMKANSGPMKKSRSGIQRSTILSFLARLEVEELLPFFILLVKPFEITFVSTATECIGGKKAWEVTMHLGPKKDFIDWIKVEELRAIPFKKKTAFLHLIRDVLGTFDQGHVGIYLHAFLALIFRILESLFVNTGIEDMEINSGISGEGLCFTGSKPDKIHCHSDENSVPFVVSCGTEDAGTVTGSGEGTMLEGLCSDKATPKTNYKIEKGFASHGVTQEIYQETVSEQSKDGTRGSGAVPDMRFKTGRKELRTLAFRVLAIVFEKYADIDFSPLYWDIFFCTIRPLVARFKQENISSGAPNALFSCFLAISRSVGLFPVLQREKDLIPNVVSILSDRNASSSLIHVVLTFVENILNLDNDISSSGRVIVPEVAACNLPLLLSGIRDLLGTSQNYCRDKQESFSSGRVLQILKKLCKYIKSPSEASKLVPILLPFLKLKKHVNIEECEEVLHVIKEISPILDTKNHTEIIPFFAPILASIGCQNIRITICKVLEEFALVDPSLYLVVKLIVDLNSLSVITIGEYDYDRRLQAYDRLSPALFPELTYAHTVLIISQAAYDMGAKDIAIRHSSSTCLFSFIHFASSVFRKQQESSENKAIADEKQQSMSMEIECKISPAADTAKGRNPLSWSSQSVNSIVQKVLLPHIRNVMVRNDSLSVRKEWTLVLREMVVNLESHSSFSEYLPLISTDLEVDFFHNISHIQSHRRVRAMSRFKTVCSVGRFRQGTLVRIFIPLFMNLMFEATGETEGNLVIAAVDALSCIAAQLDWESYSGFLIRLFRMINSKHGYEKVLVRLICSIVDHFHFFGMNCEKQGTQAVNTDSGKEGFEQHPNHDLCNGFSDVVTVNKEQKVDIQSRLQKQFLPELTKLLVSKEGIVNSKVALAVVKLLKLMSEETVEIELPRIVQSIVNLLKNRRQAVRDEARCALVAIVKVLGAHYLHFIVNSLQSSLTRGFEVHVLGFTLHSILVQLVPLISVGQIDYCADKILEILENDMFGDVSEEKEVEKIASKMKETKRIQSFESLRFLAQVVTFKTYTSILLKPVKENLYRSLAPKIKLKIEMMLRQLALGIHGNSFVKKEELLVFLHEIMENGIMEEKRKVATGKIINTDLCVTKDHLQRQNFQDRSIPNLHLMTEFGLQLLYGYLKSTMNKLDAHALSMLDPFVNLIQCCLESKYEGVLSLSMNCLCQLLRLPLPSFATSGSQILNAVLSMAEKFGKQDSPLVRACFDLLVVLFKHARDTEATNEQLQFLLQLPLFIDLESSKSNTGLLLVKAIVQRKLLVPELYDIINRVAQLMIVSEIAVVQKHCSEILLQFLLDYPLGFKRLQQHLDFFVTNLSYEQTCGREAALEMLHAVIVKFPEQVIDEQLDTLFLPLVTRLVNDEAKHVREMIGTVLKILMGRVSQQSLQRMLNFCFSWLKDVKQHLWHPAAQVLGFLIEIMKGKFSHYVQDVVLVIESILTYASEFEDKRLTDNSQKPVSWQEAYYALKLFEKLLTQLPDICFQKSLQNLWNLTCTFLLHQHIWLRKVSSDLIGKYFTGCDLSSETVGFMLERSMLMSLAATFCEQLDADLSDEFLAEQITKNLLFVTCTLYRTTHNPHLKTSWADMVNDSNHSVQVRVSNALDRLGVGGLRNSRNVADVHQNAETNVQIEENASQGKTYFLLWPVFRKVKEITLQIEIVKTKAMLKWYGAVSTELGSNDIQPYLSSMMFPLYKINESYASKNIPDDLKALSEEVLNHIKELVGVSRFVQAYNEARKVVKDRREERKHNSKLGVLLDPEHHAKRKMALAVKHQAQKKRKVLRLRK